MTNTRLPTSTELVAAVLALVAVACSGGEGSAGSTSSPTTNIAPTTVAVSTTAVEDNNTPFTIVCEGEFEHGSHGLLDAADLAERPVGSPDDVAAEFMRDRGPLRPDWRALLGPQIRVDGERAKARWVTSEGVTKLIVHAEVVEGVWVYAGFDGCAPPS